MATVNRNCDACEFRPTCDLILCHKETAVVTRFEPQIPLRVAEVVR